MRYHCVAKNTLYYNIIRSSISHQITMHKTVTEIYQNGNQIFVFFTLLPSNF